MEKLLQEKKRPSIKDMWTKSEVSNSTLELNEGKGAEEDMDKLVDVANKIEGRTICALGDAAAWPVQSFLKHYRHEFEYMINNGGKSIVDSPEYKAA